MLSLHFLDERTKCECTEPINEIEVYANLPPSECCSLVSKSKKGMLWEKTNENTSYQRKYLQKRRHTKKEMYTQIHIFEDKK